MVVCSQLHILNDSLENIQELALLELKKVVVETKKDKDMLNEILIAKLQECIQHHRTILK